MTRLRAIQSHGPGAGEPIAAGRSRSTGFSAPYAEQLKTSEDARLRAEEIAGRAQAELARLSRLMSAGQFASWITHEINQPIGAIVTNGEATLRWLSKEVPNLPEAQAAVLCIIRDAHRASAVINSTRAMLARDKPVFFDVDLNEILKDVIQLTQGERTRSRVIVRTSLLPGLPPIKGDRIQLQQVALNLILNGIEAMRSVHNRRRVLQIRSDVAESGDVMVAVEDCGIGFDPADADRLFDHFFTTKADGLGLGLPISRSIIEAHGGRLWASPASPRGAIFQFAIPRSTGVVRDEPTA